MPFILLAAAVLALPWYFGGATAMGHFCLALCVSLALLEGPWGDGKSSRRRAAYLPRKHRAPGGEAQGALEALKRFDALWVTGGEQGYLSAEEVAANQRAVAAFGASVWKLFIRSSAAGSEVSSAGISILTLLVSTSVRPAL